MMRWCKIISVAVLCVIPSLALAQTGEDPGQPPAEASVRTTPPPGYFGILGDDRHDEGRGVRIVNVTPGSPAEAADLRIGDLIVEINSQPIRRTLDLAPLMATSIAGQKLQVDVQRDGNPLSREVVLSQRVIPRQVGQSPPLTASGNRSLPIGLRTVPLDFEMMERLRVPIASGAVITEVAADSPASQAALPVGGVIVGVNDFPVATPEELAAAIRQVGESSLRITYYIGLRRFEASFSLREPTDSAEANSRGAPPNPMQIRQLEEKVQRLEERIEFLERQILNLVR